MAEKKKATPLVCECGISLPNRGALLSHQRGRAHHERMKAKEAPPEVQEPPEVQPPENVTTMIGQDAILTLQGKALARGIMDKVKPDIAEDPRDAEIRRLREELAQAKGEKPKGPRVWPEEFVNQRLVQKALEIVRDPLRNTERDHLITCGKLIRQGAAMAYGSNYPKYLPGSIRDFMKDYNIPIVAPPRPDAAVLTKGS